MLNNSQLELLEHYLGLDGIYTLSLKESTGLSTMAKFIYFKRACMAGNCYQFNRFLDTLYNGCNLELIRTLKTVNNLCFNQNVVYGNNQFPALEHFFRGLGPINSDELKSACHKTAMESALNLFKPKYELRQLNRPREDRPNRLNRQWRTLLRLPLAQRVIGNGTPTSLLRRALSHRLQAIHPDNLEIVVVNEQLAQSRLEDSSSVESGSVQNTEAPQLLFSLRVERDEVPGTVNQIRDLIESMQASQTS